VLGIGAGAVNEDMIVESSIVRTTGQWWKVSVGIWTIAIGGVVLWSGMAMLGRHAPSYVLWVILGGVALVCAGLAFVCLAVRCPSCHARWVWLSIKGQGVRNFGRVFSELKECPVCHAK
jgi:hypothetical protein